MKVGTEQLLEMFRKMVLIRQFETRVKKSFADGDIPGFIHLSVGQEAIGVGCITNLRDDDYIVSHHRGHGHLIAKGGNINLMMAELYGKKTGYCKGKGGSMHLADMEHNMLGAHGIVGSTVTIATGAGLSAKLRKSGQVTLCFLGDGASNTGRFHEGINLAAIWDLPIVYIIENNFYAEATHISYSTRVKKLSDRAIAYGIPGETIDSNDVVEIYEKVGKAIDRARMGKGPSLIECQTYRHFGHEEGDMETYKKKSDIEAWMKKDPIEIFKKRLIEEGILTQTDADRINQKMKTEVEEAVKFAKESPYPALEETLEDVYV
jgi:TPP-dependent pyruvate/acetoin dehydrogenase alpha subunit